MINTVCAICKSKQRLRLLYKKNFDTDKIDVKLFSARRSPDGIHYRIVKCLRCGLIFSSPILEEKKIREFYSKSGFHYEDQSSYLSETYSRYLSKILPRRRRERLTLLDIGCGNGFFLKKVIEMGIKNVYGVEPGKPSVLNAPKILQRVIKIGFLRRNLFRSNYFDVITCFHTLDHVLDPNQFLKTTYSLLKSSGRAFFIVHDTDGLSVKLFGERSPIFDIEHIYLFNKETLGRIFVENGFKNVEVFDIKNTYPISYWFKMAPIPRNLKTQLANFLIKTSLDFPLTLAAGNIGIFAHKK
jgi:SAM-dependent methyltransferase